MNPARNLAAAVGRLFAWAASAVLLALLALPIVALLLRVAPMELLSRLASPLVMDALRLSLVASVAATALAVLLGIPVAIWIAQTRSPLARLASALVDLGLVLPPTVAGAGLLFALGSGGPLAAWAASLGIASPPSMAAVVLAQTFVAAPWFVSSLVAGLRAVEPRYAEIASTLRASPDAVLFRVLLPLAVPSLLAGVAMSGTRALAEFGATITLAGNVPGVSRTMPSAVFAALQSDSQAAVAMSLLLIVISFALLLLLRLLPTPLLTGASHASRDRR